MMHETQSPQYNTIADPDLHANDGVYSCYLTDFSGGEGRYTVTLHVTDNQGRAFTVHRAEGETQYHWKFEPYLGFC